MALFQRSARTQEEAARGKPLDLAPQAVAELSEDEWYARAYRGDDLPQLTVRAVVTGSLLGFLLAFTNLYVGLKTGWGVGIAITACILSFSIGNALVKARVMATPLSILESNCMQSTASAAGYSTGSAMVSAVPALLILSVSNTNPRGHHLPWPALALWTFFVALLGVVMAVPMKRNMINQERLTFPSGVAAATTLQSLYSQGGEALKKARALFIAAGISGLTPLLMDLKVRKVNGDRVPLLPSESPVFDWLPAPGHDAHGAAYKPSHWTLVLDHKLVMIAAGALVGLRISISMMIAALLLAFVVGPAALARHAIITPESAWREMGVWLGAPMMVSSGLVSFALQWRTIGRALRGLGSTKSDGARADVEVPGSWFGMGLLVASVGVVAVSHIYFQIPWPLGVLAVLMTFFLSLVACRATGESDITPIGAMGKIMQLVYGVLIPQSATANLMTAGITASASVSSADLLTDLKAGYLLGANPRRQFMAQLLGIFAGTAATVCGFYILVPDATTLTGVDGKPPAFPAPAAQSWLAVARVFQEGFSHLHPMARTLMIVGGAVGLVLVLLETWLPKARAWLPSATGLGLGFILPFQYPLSMLLGALIAWVWTRRQKDSAERYIVPLSSGIVAGESILGVIVAAINNTFLG